MEERSGLQLAAWAVAAIAAVLIGVRLLDSGSAQPPVRVAGQHDPSERGRPRANGPAGPYVHVAGAVRRPGLYRLARGTRVAAAVARAGGPSRRADMDSINLAALLQDGQQVVVPAHPEHAAGGAAAVAEPPVSLGTATVEQLDALDGIGPTLAERIVEHRQAHGGFRSVDQLDDVEGIGAKRLETLAESLTP